MQHGSVDEIDGVGDLAKVLDERGVERFLERLGAIRTGDEKDGTEDLVEAVFIRVPFRDEGGEVDPSGCGFETLVWLGHEEQTEYT